jgi:hypothetical protein
MYFNKTRTLSKFFVVDPSPPGSRNFFGRVSLLLAQRAGARQCEVMPIFRPVVVWRIAVSARTHALASQRGVAANDPVKTVE